MLATRALAVASALCLSTFASADLVNIVSNSALSTESQGTFSGSIGWSYSGGNAGVLTVSLTNTSPLGNGGYLTGFLFRSATALTSSLSTTSDPDFLNIPGGATAPPFGGTYQGGAALGGDWTGGGSPTPGLGVGASGVFTFAITSAGASGLSASSFISGAYDFVVRFKGFGNGASDKVPGQLIPAPGAIALLSFAGSLGATGRRRRR